MVAWPVAHAWRLCGERRSLSLAGCESRGLIGFDGSPRPRGGRAAAAETRRAAEPDAAVERAGRGGGCGRRAGGRRPEAGAADAGSEARGTARSLGRTLPWKSGVHYGKRAASYERLRRLPRPSRSISSRSTRSATAGPASPTRPGGSTTSRSYPRSLVLSETLYPNAAPAPGQQPGLRRGPVRREWKKLGSFPGAARTRHHRAPGLGAQRSHPRVALRRRPSDFKACFRRIVQGLRSQHRPQCT
jgi:hypothetical protein